MLWHGYTPLSPRGFPLVKATLQGLQRMLARPVHKEAPATVRMLEQMMQDRVALWPICG